MKVIIVFVFLMGVFFIVGFSGNFREYLLFRVVSVMVVFYEDGYVGFNCLDGEIVLVIVLNGEGKDFDVMMLENQFIINEYVSIILELVYCYVLVGMYLDVESGMGILVDIVFGDLYIFGGYVVVSLVIFGEYYVLVMIYVIWDGGGVVIESCFVKIIVFDDLRIMKILFLGNMSDIFLKIYQEWMFQIEVFNLIDNDLNLMVRDIILVEFNVSFLEVLVSLGMYSFWVVNQGNGNGNGNLQNGNFYFVIKMKWKVLVLVGGSEYINVMIFIRVNNGNQQEFILCGIYLFNDGVIIDGYLGRSNGIEVSVVCLDDD